jgi:hypothetical protein
MNAFRGGGSINTCSLSTFIAENIKPKNRKTTLLFSGSEEDKIAAGNGICNIRITWLKVINPFIVHWQQTC